MSLSVRHLVEVDDQNASDDDHFSGERLKEVKVTLSPQRSPDHLARPVVSSSSARVSKKTKRKKPQASASDAYLLMNMEPNRPDIYRQAATNVLDVHSVSGDESMPDVDEVDDVEEEDLDTMLARKMAEKEVEDAKKYKEAAKEQQIAQRRQEWEKQRAADEEREEQERQAGLEKQRQEGEAKENQRREDDERRRAEQERLELEKTAQMALAHTSPAQSEEQNGSPAEDSIKPEPSQGGGLCITVPDRSKEHSLIHPPIYNGLQTPLEPRRMSLSYQHQHESLKASPLSAHLKHGNSEDQKLPALQSPGTTDGPGSPQSGKLPGFANIAQIAEKAHGEISRQRQHSFSMGAPSPYSVRSPYPFTHPSPAPSETSPRSGLPMGITSPQGISGSFFSSNRRPSVAGEYPHGLPSASSTDNSYASASTDGYSPSTNPTPQSDASHRLSIDGTINTEGRPILPPPVPSLQSLAISSIPPHGSPGGFTCDFPGCTAQAFQTQYLLKYALDSLPF
jgi:hypothetical protein